MEAREFFLLVIVFLVLVFILFPYEPKVESAIIRLGNATIVAEIADTEEERKKGLIDRKSMEEFEGMLFIFDKEDYYGFWTQNMSFPIDIVWISSNKTVVDISKNLQPCQTNCEVYRPKEKVLYVIEVNANFTEKHNVEIGSVVEFKVS